MSCLAWSGSGTGVWRDSGNKEGRVKEAKRLRAKDTPLSIFDVQSHLLTLQKLFNPSYTL